MLWVKNVTESLSSAVLFLLLFFTTRKNVFIEIINIFKTKVFSHFAEKKVTFYKYGYLLNELFSAKSSVKMATKGRPLWTKSFYFIFGDKINGKFC